MKKYIALLLALIITTCTLAACAASVPSSPSSHVPVSSSAVSVPPSSVPVSSLPQSSSVSSTQSFLPSSVILPQSGISLISKTDNNCVYNVTLVSFGESSGNTLGVIAPFSHITYNVTFPYPSCTKDDDWYIYMGSEERVAEMIGTAFLLTEGETLKNLAVRPENEVSIENTSNDEHGPIILSSGCNAYYYINKREYGQNDYSFSYYLDIGGNMVVIIRFHVNYQTEDFDIQSDTCLFESIVSSVEVVY